MTSETTTLKKGKDVSGKDFHNKIWVVLEEVIAGESQYASGGATSGIGKILCQTEAIAHKGVDAIFAALMRQKLDRKFSCFVEKGEVERAVNAQMSAAYEVVCAKYDCKESKDDRRKVDL